MLGQLAINSMKKNESSVVGWLNPDLDVQTTLDKQIPTGTTTWKVATTSMLILYEPHPPDTDTYSSLIIGSAQGNTKFEKLTP